MPFRYLANNVQATHMQLMLVECLARHMKPIQIQAALDEFELLMEENPALPGAVCLFPRRSDPAGEAPAEQRQPT